LNARPGITLIELLATLSLLTLLSVVSVSWMTTTLKSQSAAENNSNWARASGAVLDLIGQDLLTVDRLDTDGRSRKPRVTAEEHQLSIRSRSQLGVGAFHYVFEPISGKLHRRWNGKQESQEAIALLGRIDSFSAQMDMPSETQATPSLLVTLVSDDGQQIQRIYILDREDVQ